MVKRRRANYELFWRGTYLRRPVSSTSSGSTKTGSTIFMLRNVRKGGACSGRLGSSVGWASSCAHWFKACLVLNPRSFQTSVAYILSP